MEETNIKKLYDQLLKDKDFDKMDLGLKNPNIFQILRISKNEIRHSNFLSWLLETNGSHKLGDIFLKRFLREVLSLTKYLSSSLTTWPSILIILNFFISILN